MTPLQASLVGTDGYEREHLAVSLFDIADQPISPVSHFSNIIFHICFPYPWKLMKGFEYLPFLIQVTARWRQEKPKSVINWPTLNWQPGAPGYPVPPFCGMRQPRGANPRNGCIYLALGGGNKPQLAVFHTGRVKGARAKGSLREASVLFAACSVPERKLGWCWGWKGGQPPPCLGLCSWVLFPVRPPRRTAPLEKKKNGVISSAEVSSTPELRAYFQGLWKETQE